MTIHVPYLSKAEMERHAELLLLEYKLARGMDRVLPIPVEDILERHLRLTLDFDDLHAKLGIPMTSDEPEVFGALWVETREVFVDQSLDPEEHPEREGRYRYTLAHEIGHWHLHKDYLRPEHGSTDPSAQAGDAAGVICRASAAKERIE